MNGSLDRPDFFNICAPGVAAGRGYDELRTDHLWEIDTTSQQYGLLAAELPTPLNDDFASWEIKPREGIYGDDGVEFTADDLLYTLNMWLETEGIAIHGWATDYIDSVEQVDQYTLILNTTRPQPRLAKDLGVTIWGNRLYPMPKHVWENEDPASPDPQKLGPPLRRCPIWPPLSIVNTLHIAGESLAPQNLGPARSWRVAGSTPAVLARFATGAESALHTPLG